MEADDLAPDIAKLCVLAAMIWTVQNKRVVIIFNNMCPNSISIVILSVYGILL